MHPFVVGIHLDYQHMLALTAAQRHMLMLTQQSGSKKMSFFISLFFLFETTSTYSVKDRTVYILAHGHMLLQQNVHPRANTYIYTYTNTRALYKLNSNIDFVNVSQNLNFSEKLRREGFSYQISSVVLQNNFFIKHFLAHPHGPNGPEIVTSTYIHAR